MSDRGGGASLGTAEGRITVDTSQAVGALGQLGNLMSSFDAKAAQVGGTTSDFTQSTVGLAQGMQHIGRVSIGLGATLSAPFVLAAKSAIDFEQAMANTNSVMDLTESQFADISDLALQLGQDTVFTAEEAASGIEVLGKAGIGFEDIMQGAGQAITDLAAAGQIDIPRAAEVMSAAMNAFGIAGEDAVTVADALAGAANASQTDINQLGLGLGQVAGIADTANMSLEETVSFLALMADNGIRGSDAATSMKTSILKLLSPSEQASEAMAELGINLLDTEGNFIGLQDASQEFYDAWKRSGQTLSEFMQPLGDIFGTDAIRTILFGMQAIESDVTGVGKGFEFYNDAVSETGAAADVAAKRMDTFQGAIERLRGSLSSLFTKAGLPALDFFRPFVEGAVQVINAITNLPQPILATAAAISGVVGAITAAGGAFLVVGGYILEAVARMEAAGVPLSRVIGLLVRLGAVLTGIGLIAAGVGLAFENNWFGVSDKLDQFLGAFERFKGYSQYASGLARAIQALGQAIDVTFGTDVSGFFDSVARAIDPLARGVERLGEFTDIFNRFRSYSQRVTSLGKSLQALGQTIDVLFGTDVSTLFDTLALGADTFSAELANLLALDFDPLSANIIALGLAIQTAFGENIVSDTLLGLGKIIYTLTEAFQFFRDQGLNPVAAALGALAAGANVAGIDQLGDALIGASNAAQQFGTVFRSVNINSLLDGYNGAASAVLAFGEALRQVIGIDITDYTFRLAEAIQAAGDAWEQARSAGLDPFTSALLGLRDAASVITGIDLAGFFDSLGLSLAGVRDALQGNVGEGIARVGEALGGIANAVLAGDWAGALTIVQQFVTDVRDSLVDLANTIGTIDVAQIAINIGGWIVNAAQTVGEAIHDFVFGNTGGAPSPGLGGVAGQSGGLTGGVPIGTIAVNIAGWIVNAAQNLADVIRSFVQSGGRIGGGFAGEGGPRDVGPSPGQEGISVGNIAITIAGWVVNAAEDLWSAIQRHFGFGTANSMGGPGERGEAGTASGGVTLDAVRVNITSWAQGAWASVSQLAGEIKGWLTDQLSAAAISIENFTGWSLSIGAPGGGTSELSGSGDIAGRSGNFVSAVESLIKNQLTAAAIAIDDFTGWQLTVSTPEGGVTIDVEAVKRAIGTALNDLYTVDPSFVEGAGNAGETLGRAIGEAFAAGITTALESFTSADSGVVTVDQQLAEVVTGAGLGDANQFLNLGDAFAAFDQEFTNAFKEAIDPEFEQARNAIAEYLVQKAGDFFATPLPGIGGTSAPSPTGAGQWIGEQVLAIMGIDSAGGIADLGQDDNTRVLIEKGVEEYWDTNVDQPIQTALDRKAQEAQTSLFSGMPTLDWAQGIKEWLVPSASAAELGADDVVDGVMEPLRTEVPPSIQREMEFLADDVEGATEAGFSTVDIASTIDQILTDTTQGMSLADFSRQIGEGINDAILAGISGASPEGGGSFRGGTGTLGPQLAETLMGAIERADFSAVGTALQTKISESLAQGVSEGDASQAAGAAGGLGTSVADAIASQIGSADFSAVGSALQAKIGTALLTGVSQESGAAAAGAAGGLGTSIAQAIASQIGTADFTAVAQAIQTKIGEAFLSGSATAQAGLGGSGTTGIGTSIASTIASQVAGADWSAVGQAISTALGNALGAGTGTIQAAINAVIGAVIAAGNQAAAQASTIGQTIATTIGTGVGPATGNIVAAVQAAVQAGIAAGTTVAAGAITIGSTLTTNIGNGIGQGTGTVTAAMQASVQAAISAGTSAASAATAIGAALTQNTASGVTSGQGVVSSALTGMISAAIEAGKGAAAGASAIGAAIAQGIAAGVESGTGIVSAAVAGIVRAGIAAGQQAADTGSPSQVAIDEIGTPIAQGVQVGIEKGAPAATKAGQELSEQTIKGMIGAVESAKELRNLGEQFLDMQGFEDVGQFIGSIADELIASSKEIRSGARDLLSGLGDELRRGADRVGKDAGSVGSALNSGFSSGGSSASKPSRDSLRGVKDIIRELQGMGPDIAQLEDMASQLDKVRGFHDLGDQVRAAADEIEANREDLLGSARSLFSELKAQFREQMRDFRQSGKEVGDSIASGVEEGVSSAMESVSSTTESLTDQIKNQLNPNLSRLPEMAEAMGMGVGEGVSEGIEQSQPLVEDTAANLGDSVASGLEAGAPAVESAATKVVENTTDALDSAASGQSEFARSIGELIATTFGEGFAQGADPASSFQMVKTFGDGIRNAVANIVPQVQARGASIGTAFSTGVDSANPTQSGKGLVDEVTTGVTSGVDGATNAADRAGTTIGNSLKDAISSACSPVNTEAQDLTDSCVPKGIAAGENAASKVAQDAGENISENLVDGLDVKKKEVERAFDTGGKGFGKALSSGIGSTAQDAVNSANDVSNRAGNVDGGQDGRAVGRSFGQGIAQGIEEYIPQIIEAAKEAVRKAEEAAKSESKSKSPSRLFAEIGRDLSLGMALGMQEASSSVVAAAEGLIQGTKSALSGTAITAAVRMFDSNLDTYTKRIEDTVAFADRAMTHRNLPASALTPQSGLTTQATTMPSQEVTGEGKTIIIEGITIDPSSPEGEALMEFIDILEASSGQYGG